MLPVGDLALDRYDPLPAFDCSITRSLPTPELRREHIHADAADVCRNAQSGPDADVHVPEDIDVSRVEYIHNRYVDESTSHHWLR